MKEIVVARNSAGPLKAIVLICLIIVTGRSWAIWWPVRFVLLGVVFSLAYVALERYSRMKLSVTADKVHVVNFNSKFTLSLDSVMIDDEKNLKVWPKDDMVKFKDGTMGNGMGDEEPLDLSVNDPKPGEEEDVTIADVTDIRDAPSAGGLAEFEIDEDEEHEEELVENLDLPADVPTVSNIREVKKARSLILTDASGVKAQVGVAPAYGDRLDEIAEELYIAIDRMRAVGG